MKRVVRVMVAAMSCAWAYGSCAQGSVTLYGVIDPDVVFVSNAQVNKAGGALHGHRQVSMLDASTSAYAGSRFGLQGKEDLGGGTSAIFTLENGFNAANGALGQGGALFGRQAFVGLANERIGKVTLGRQYSPVVDFLSPMTAIVQWGGFIAAHPDDIDNLGMTARQNNAVKVASPTWHGWSASAMYGVGGVARHASQNQTIAAGLGYTSGALRIGFGYMSAYDPNVSIWGSQPNGGGSEVNNIGSLGSATTPEKNPVIAGYASAHRLQTAGAGASYALGRATLGAIYTNTRFIGLGSAAGPNPLGYAGSATFNTIEVNGAYRITPALSLGAAYSYTLAHGPEANNAHYNQANAGIHYALSKRTDVYMVAVYQRASGVDSLGQAAVASINGMTPSASRQQFVDAIGLAHRF
ncbi:porin [Burkholderia sp. BCC0397]|uniref:porin n=1 Tax=Burkholderia sp. BCC0397 TaxID=486876 RepID=UPI00158BF992|nr:porin [Burkholderia sp. BCC0397]